MNTQEPKCADGYILDKEKCMCVAKPKTPSPLQLKSPKKNTVKKRTRCPKGTRKNPKTGKCEPTGVKAPSPKATKVPSPKATKAPSPKATKVPSPKATKAPTPKAPTPKAPTPKAPTPKAPTPKAPSPKAISSASFFSLSPTKTTAKKRTRCPKGTRKNPKTGKCESSKTVAKTKTATKTVAKTKKKEQPIVIPSSTPADITELSREVSKHISQKKPISPEKMIALVKSFSPSIHARLEQMNSSPVKGKKLTKEKLPLETQRNRMLDCLDEHALISKYQLSDNKRDQERRYEYTFLYDQQMPHIYVDGGCYPAKNLKSQKLLLKSLNESIKRVNMTNLVTPKQYASNCWFNSFFVVFFLGDKGRKFSKSLRHMMITQRGPGESTMIDNLKMRKTMFAFNLAIEASLTGNPMSYKLNTNSLVVSLADSMPYKYKKKMPKYDKASNPMTFYNGLMDYFKNVHNVKGISISNYQNYSIYHDFSKPEDIKLMTSKYSDLITIEVFDTHKGKGGVYNSSKRQNKPLKLVGDSTEYTLGAVVIRDTKRRHFCCVCDVNGKEYGFDGASFKRLNPFEWRKLLNTSKTWTFEGSDWIGGKDDGKPILWNFMNGYQILFYYRTK